MSNLKIFSEDIKINNKRVIVRLDLNVPISKSSIEDSTRIEIIEPFIKKLIEKKAKIILISHLGRPKGKVVKELSLNPIFDYLQKSLNTKVYFYKDNIDQKAIDASNNLKQGEVLLIENIRFFKEEEDDNENFAKNLSKLGDFYINEAFSCSHRRQASLHKITNYIDSYGGPLLDKETQSINLIIKNKKKPVTSIIGGSKVSTKINVLLNLSKNTNNLIIVGAMANNFLKFNGLNVGASLLEKGTEDIIKSIYSSSEKNNCNIIIPIDCVVSNDLNGLPKPKSLNEIKSEDIILDIGEKTIELINKTVELSKTVFWNGPAGYFENKNFSKGTLSIAKKISSDTDTKSLISIVGGGDTIAALKNVEFRKVFTHLSTAGGAFLESIEGKELPGIKVLKK